MEEIDKLTEMGDYWHDQFIAASRAKDYADEQLQVILQRIEAIQQPLGALAVIVPPVPTEERNFTLINGELT